MTEEKVATHLLAQRLLFNDRFESVDSLYADYIARYPGDPSGYLFRAAGLLAEMSGCEEDLHGGRFETLLDSVSEIVDRNVGRKEGREKAWLRLWKGHAKAYRSIYISRFGSFVSALKLGLSSRGDYNDALEADSSLYDIYFGIGSYHYWKSAKSGILRWLGIFKNEKEKGIEELRLAIDSSVLSRDAARSGLVWIWLDQKKYDSVIALAGEMAHAYPDGNSFLWPLAYAHYERKQFEQAATLYDRLRQRLAEDAGNYYNLIEADYRLTRSLEKLSRNSEASLAAGRLDEYFKYVPRRTRDRQEGAIAFLRRIGS